MCDSKLRSQWLRGVWCTSVAVRLLRNVGSNPAGTWMSLVNVVCCQIVVFAKS